MRKPTDRPAVMDTIETLVYDNPEFGLELARDAHGEAEIHDGLTESYARIKDVNGKEYWVIVKEVG